MTCRRALGEPGGWAGCIRHGTHHRVRAAGPAKGKGCQLLVFCWCCNSHATAVGPCLCQGAAPYLETQQVWVALTGLLKMIQYDPESFPACVEALSWWVALPPHIMLRASVTDDQPVRMRISCRVVHESLTPLNFPLVLQALVDLLERAAAHASKGVPLASATSAGAPRQGVGSPPVLMLELAASRSSSAPAQAAASGAQGQGGQAAALGNADTGSLGAAGGSDPAIATLLSLLKQSGIACL